MEHSILFHKGKPAECDDTFFHDLNLDQVFESASRVFGGGEVLSWYRTPLTDPEEITRRQEVFRDLEDESLRTGLRAFCTEMLAILRGILNFSNPSSLTGEACIEKRHFLKSAKVYVHLVEELSECLKNADIRSEALLDISRYLGVYSASSAYRSFAEEVFSLSEALDSIRYRLILGRGEIRVRPYASEADAVQSVYEAFGPIIEGTSRDKVVGLPGSAPRGAGETGSGGAPRGAGEIGLASALVRASSSAKFRSRRNYQNDSFDLYMESRIIDMVISYYPDEFRGLDSFCRRYAHFEDTVICDFASEIRFYISWINYTMLTRRAGLPFCYPCIYTASDKHRGSLSDEASFDIALAHKRSGRDIVCNDILLIPPERILVITGPNQGGKTTYARAFGQVIYLTRLGLFVPGKKASIPLVDRIFTHFENEEDPTLHYGALASELEKLRDMFLNVTDGSLVILNEIFSSTTFEDALDLGRRLMRELDRRGCIVLLITFIDQMASANEHTVSMVSITDPRDPEKRTYRIERKNADGMAYAQALASKHHLSEDDLRQRLKANRNTI